VKIKTTPKNGRKGGRIHGSSNAKFADATKVQTGESDWDGYDFDRLSASDVAWEGSDKI
jgi:hypothetical protein